MSGPTGAIGIVLAGGRSRRLAAAGLPAGGKPALVHDGRAFLERVVSVVAAEVDRVLVVSGADQPLPPLPAAVEIVRDSEPGGGPLAGIRDALAVAARLVPPPGTAFVCACDVPLVRRDVVRLLVARGLEAAPAWVVPLHQGHPQVLLSAVAVSLLPRIEGYLATGRRDPRGLIDRLAAESPPHVAWIGPETLAAVDPVGDSLFDIDTPADLARLRGRGIPPSAG